MFAEPFNVELIVETWPTPQSYRGEPGGDKLPDKMAVWRVQETGKRANGIVYGSSRAKHVPETETLALGYAIDKPYGSVSIGRCENLLEWGYYAPPSQMTESGRRLFLNCIWYIRGFGQAPSRENTMQAEPEGAASTE